MLVRDRARQHDFNHPGNNIGKYQSNKDGKYIVHSTYITDHDESNWRPLLS